MSCNITVIITNDYLFFYYYNVLVFFSNNFFCIKPTRVFFFLKVWLSRLENPHKYVIEKNLKLLQKILKLRFSLKTQKKHCTNQFKKIKAKLVNFKHF